MNEKIEITLLVLLYLFIAIAGIKLVIFLLSGK